MRQLGRAGGSLAVSCPRLALGASGRPVDLSLDRPLEAGHEPLRLARSLPSSVLCWKSILFVDSSLIRCFLGTSNWSHGPTCRSTLADYFSGPCTVAETLRDRVPNDHGTPLIKDRPFGCRLVSSTRPLSTPAGSTLHADEVELNNGTLGTGEGVLCAISEHFVLHHLESPSSPARDWDPW